MYAEIWWWQQCQAMPGMMGWCWSESSVRKCLGDGVVLVLTLFGVLTYYNYWGARSNGNDMIQDIPPGDLLSSYLDASKAIVFMSCLLQLLSVCPLPGCGSAIDPENREVKEHGAVIVIHYTCNSHHSGHWCSSPSVGEGKKKVWVLNTVLASYSLTCGLHISQVT